MVYTVITNIVIMRNNVNIFTKTLMPYLMIFYPVFLLAFSQWLYFMSPRRLTFFLTTNYFFRLLAEQNVNWSRITMVIGEES